MAVKSIVDVEVNDDAFQKFKAAYAEYQADLDKAPDAWAKVSASTEVSAAALMVLAEHSAEMLKLARDRADNEKIISEEVDTQAKSTERQARSWHDMAKDTREFAKNIGSATVSILKWAGITGAISGLIGGGGLFGIDRLAQSVSGQRRLSGGTGTTIGERNAFETDYGRLLGDPGGFLTNVFESQTDVTKAAPYAALGLDYSTERRKAPADAALDVINGLKSLADSTPKEALGSVYTSRRLGELGVSLEDFENIRERSRSELEEYRTRFQKDRRDLNVTDPEAKKWEDLNVQLDRAWKTIKNAFVDVLTPLTPNIQALSEAFSKMVKDLLNSGLAKDAVEELRLGLKKLDEIITDPNFEKNVKAFVDDVASIVEAVGSAVGRLSGWINGKPQTQQEKDDWQKEEDRRLENQRRWDEAHPKGGAPAPGEPGGGRAAPPDFMPGGGSQYVPINFRPSSGASPAVTGGRVDEAHDFFRAAGWSEAQTAGLLANLGAESGFRPDARNPSGHAGIAQWDASRQARFRALFGHDPGDGSRSDYEQQLWFVQWELTHTERAAGDRLRAVGRDPGAAAAVVDRGYERSEGTTTNARMGAAAQYMQQFKDRSVKVLIQNNTGGNANVTATQLQT